MKNWKWYSLPALPTVLIVAAATALLSFALSTGDKGPLAYGSYLLSTYALIVGVSGLIRLLPRVKKGFAGSRLMQRLHANRRLSRYLDDPVYRTRLNLYLSVAINLLYIILKLFTGILYRSEWLIVFALYYMALTALRVSLVNFVRRREIRDDLPAEYRRYRLVGALLVPMNLALTLIIARMIGHSESAEYPGVMIFGMAAYVFYAVILAIVNVFRSRRHGSPVLSAVKLVNLTAALVALMSLEAAMLSRFGGEDDPRFRATMLGISGAVVCFLILGMSSYMIIHATKKLNGEESKHE